MKIAAACLFALPLLAQAQLQSREQLIADAVRDYGMVFGGLAINAQCMFLDDAALQAYMDATGVITPALKQDLGDGSLLARAMDAGLAEGRSEKYDSCDAKAKEIVEAAAGHAQRWAGQIQRIQGIEERAN
jgi:hypothetical protein